MSIAIFKFYYFVVHSSGRMETSLEFAEDCIRVARQCQLPKLVSYIEDSLKKTLEFRELTFALHVIVSVVF